ncbi:MAG: glycosyltransferase family 39 protein [Anaerolineales bacterium]|nr:glycosyltransferase family 39 protein [Anaerolineales bacterium]MCB8939360.1 glycosyltransferase family 39 protein [Ardenticatenaceae bacterium]
MLLYAVLGVGYMLATPPLESSDEYKHYPVVQFIQAEGKLPVLDPENPGLWLQEGAQPPLYYGLMAALTSWIDTSDLPEIHQTNKHAFVGNPNQIGNKNLILHQPEKEQFPWQGSILAIYVIRLASIGLGLGTVWLTAVLGQQLFSSQVGLLAAALTAFNPMFLFISAAVNNDSLSVFLGTLGLLLMVRLWQQQPNPRLAWWRYAGLGFVLGLGILTKLSLAGLLALTGLMLFWLAWRKKQWQLFWIGGPLVLGTAVLLTGWWFWRNLSLYHDLTGLSAFIAVQGTREQPMRWADWVSEFGTFFRSYWGLFGGVNIAPPQPFYWLMNFLFVGGLAGWLRPNRPRPNRPAASWLVIAWSLILLGLLIRWTIISPAFQGRLIFPALGGINVLWSVGLLGWLPPNRRHWAMPTTVAGLALVAAVLAWRVIAPAYAFPEPATAVPQQAQIEPITFSAAGGTIQLVGVEMAPDQSTLPGGAQPVTATLYWQLVEPISVNLLSGVHLLGRNFQSVGQVDRHPASGQIPTSQWQLGQIWQDDYYIYVNKDALAPTQLRLSISLYDPTERAETAVTAANGQPLSLVLVGVPARLATKTPPPKPDSVVTAVFQEGIQLAGYTIAPATPEPGEALTLTLLWQATGQPGQAYTVFVHLVDAQSTLLATGDAPPVQGDFPTNLWRTGDWVDDTHTLPLPPDLAPGSYQILVGLYEPVSGARLQLAAGGDSVAIPLEIRP